VKLAPNVRAWVFAAQLAVLEVALRGAGFWGWHPRAVLFVLASVALARLAAASERRVVRFVAAGLVGALVFSQLAFHRYYHVPIDEQVALAARHSWADVRPVFLRVLPWLVIGSAIVGAAEVWLVRRAAPLARRPMLAAIAVAAMGLLFGGPLRDATTEVRFAQAAVTLATTRDSSGAKHDPLRRGVELPQMSSRRARPTNVLLVLTESVRASDFDAETSPELHALFAPGVRLREARAVASYTALSLSALLTGLPQTGKRDDVLAAPDLFDYTRAIGSAHYWSAHSETVFERTNAGQGLASFVTADTLLGHPIGDVEEAVAGGLDRRVAGECERRFETMGGPYFAMVHLSGTHAPYFFDEARAPFKPFSHAATWSGLDDLHRAYRNAIAEQDRSAAACVRAFVAAQKGAPWVVLLTSDHGEAFGEHAAIHHGQNLYDEQIHVPAMVLWGGAALALEEETALRTSEGAFVTHLDVVPTLLDAMGVWEHFALARHVALMPGRSLLRPAPARAPIAVTNCGEMFPCPLDAWGMLDGDRKLFAQPWDRGWKCLRTDGEERERPLEECGDLVTLSRGPFPKLPNGERNAP
jgi:glucan phosphoethanolaminetransferase (alkaline phosphatase superfamily)